jgi:hypothetical protein
MKILKAIVAVSTIGAVCIAAMLFGQDRAGVTETNPVGKLAPAPSWQLRDVNGRTVRSSDFKGKSLYWIFGPLGVGLVAWNYRVSSIC